MSISRRSFLKGSAATAALSMVSGSTMNAIGAQSTSLAAGPGNKWPGRVVVNFNKAAVDTSGANQTVIKQMVDDAIMVLTGKSTVGEAWKEVFPSTLNVTSKVAIKTNILNNGKPCPHPFSIMAICDGLQQMDFSGTKFPAANITVYDSNNGSSWDSAGYTAARFPTVKLVKDSAQAYGDGALNNRPYAKTLHDSDFLINVFSPRGHNTGSTFTLGFKSHFGTYSDPGGMHSNAAANIRDINCNGPVLNKNILSICSGIYGMNEGNGPTGAADDYSTYTKKMDSTSTAVNPSTIIMSTDPVSCDMQAIKMIRLNNGKPYATTNLPDYLKAAGGVSGTLSPVYNIGMIEESTMDLRKIINGIKPTSVTEHRNKQYNAAITVSQITGHNSCFIEFIVPSSYVNQKSKIEIWNLNGVKVNEFTSEVKGAVNQISWDERDFNGHHVGSGFFIVKLSCGILNLSAHLNLV